MKCVWKGRRLIGKWLCIVNCEIDGSEIKDIIFTSVSSTFSELFKTNRFVEYLTFTASVFISGILSSCFVALFLPVVHLHRLQFSCWNRDCPKAMSVFILHYSLFVQQQHSFSFEHISLKRKMPTGKHHSEIKNLQLNICWILNTEYIN